MRKRFFWLGGAVILVLFGALAVLVIRANLQAEEEFVDELNDNHRRIEKLLIKPAGSEQNRILERYEKKRSSDSAPEDAGAR